MNRVQKISLFLIHWKPIEAETHIRHLEQLGYTVKILEQTGPKGLQCIDALQPKAILIDLTRLPSHGREIGMALRQRKTTRTIPLLFLEGDPEKVDRIRSVLPDAIFSSWDQVDSAITVTIASPNLQPIIPPNSMESYGSVPLCKKLGIRERMSVVLLQAPMKFKSLIEPLPEGVKIFTRNRKSRNMTLWFVLDQNQFKNDFANVAEQAAGAPLWIIWTKKSSKYATDLSETIVRATGLAAGWVDYKICRIDDDWSGLLFKYRG